MNCDRASRIDIVKSLIELSRPVREISAELIHWPWDYEGEPALLCRSHVESVVRRCLSDHLSLAELEAWADAVECREDIDYELANEQWIKEALFRLANPDIEGKLTTGEFKALLQS